MLLCIFANTKQSRPLNLLCNNEIMPTHENSFHINEGKSATQVAYEATWQQPENWKHVLPFQILDAYFT